MNLDTFIGLTRAQTPVEQSRRARVFRPELRALIDARKLLRLDHILAHPDQTSEVRTFRYGHLLGSPVAEPDLLAWQARFPQHPLPGDLCDALRRFDGIHLWADLEQGRSYWGVSPLQEWEDAATVGWHAMFASPPVGAVVISYHANGDYYLVLDTARAEYRWYDLQDFDRPLIVGRTVGAVLDWLWSHERELAPPALPDSA